ncbi:hypothetical protein AAGG74_15565 [Bacillus mexicanus]|uniref:hypothetical protein n=1 Tax=Bacillus mexicanus TaxID=2834415 RepID=UPI003D1E1B06
MNECCKDNLLPVVGTVKHFVKGAEILIHNIPHYKCNVCEYLEYDIKEVKPIEYLKYALSNDLKEIEYGSEIS